MGKVLMHICCGPCAVYPVRLLQKTNMDVTGYFYNPNIHPIGEYQRRKESATKMAENESIALICEDEIQQDIWERKEFGDRSQCEYCYSQRFEKVFAYAVANNYNEVTTSLLVSPYQDHVLICDIFTRLAHETRIAFHYLDFRPYFRKGQQLAKEMDLYRQKYCGCILSLKERGLSIEDERE